MALGIAINAFANRGVRRRQAFEFLLYSGALVVVLLLLSSWVVTNAESAPRQSYNYYYDNTPIPWSVMGLADIFALILLGLGGLVIAPASVAATVASERRSGTLDQLRTTPLDPLSLVLGFVVGAPARFYLLCAGPLALHVVCGLTGVIPVGTMVASVVTLGVGTLACCMVGLALSLAPQHDTGGPFISLGVAGLLGFTGFIAAAMATERSASHWAFAHPAGALNAVMLAHNGLWRAISVGPWSIEKFSEPSMSGALALAPILSVMVSLAGGALLARASCRKLAQPHRPLFSKGQALALFALSAAMVILPLDTTRHALTNRSVGYLPLVFGIFLMPVAAVLSLLSTPDFKSWALSLRSRTKQGLFSDGAAPHAMVGAMLLIFLFFCVVMLNGGGFPLMLRDRHVVALLWALYTAFTVAPFALFATTRYTTTATRTAYSVAVGAHLFYQMISIALCADSWHGGTERMMLQIGALLGLAVPAWVVFRQRVLRQKTLAGA
jgi:hypothetical protein